MSDFYNIDTLTTELRLTAGFIMLIVSSYGIVINAYVFLSFINNSKYKSGFYTLCTSRTVSNFVNCFVFFIWCSPSTLLGFLYLPHFCNVLFGQISGVGSYVCESLVQLLMSSNRFLVTYWPMNRRGDNRYIIYISLTIAWTIGFVYFTMGLAEGCEYIYFVHLLSWAPVDSPCAQNLSEILLYTIILITTTSMTVDCLTFIKLMAQLKSSSRLITSTQSAKRNRKNRLMFAQSFMEDFLHVVDIFTSIYISQLSDELWFKFMSMSMVWLTTNVIDGTILFMFAQGIWPRWLHNAVTSKSQKLAGNNTTLASEVSNVSRM